MPIFDPCWGETAIQIDYFGVVSSQDLMDHVSQNLVKNEESHNKILKLQTTISKEKQQKTIIGASVAEIIEGSQENYKLYMIEDYLYTKEKMEKDKISMKCRHYKRKCRGRAQVENNTLFVIRISGEHSCNNQLGQDQKVQVKMESKMKQLALTTEDSLRKIYDDVCLENPAVASCIPYSKVEAAMKVRRNNALGDPFR